MSHDAQPHANDSNRFHGSAWITFLTKGVNSLSARWNVGTYDSTQPAKRIPSTSERPLPVKSRTLTPISP